MHVPGSGDATVMLWDVQTGQHLHTFQGHSASVYSVAFSPDGQLALTGSNDGLAVLWDIRTGNHLHAFRGHSEGISSVAFHPHGHRVLTGSHDGSARLWEASTGRELLRWWHLQGGSWLAVAPQGYFTGSSRDVLSLVSHRDGSTSTLIPREESLSYYRPEKVAEALGGK